MPAPREDDKEAPDDFPMIRQDKTMSAASGFPPARGTRCPLVSCPVLPSSRRLLGCVKPAMSGSPLMAGGIKPIAGGAPLSRVGQVKPNVGDLPLVRKCQTCDWWFPTCGWRNQTNDRWHLTAESRCDPRTAGCEAPPEGSQRTPLRPRTQGTSAHTSAPRRQPRKMLWYNPKNNSNASVLRFYVVRGARPVGSTRAHDDGVGLASASMSGAKSAVARPGGAAKPKARPPAARPQGRGQRARPESAATRARLLVRRSH